MTDFRNHVTDAMVAGRMSYGDLAKSLGVSRPRAWRIVNNGDRPGVELIAKIAGVLDIDAETLAILAGHTPEDIAEAIKCPKKRAKVRRAIR